MKTTMKTMAVKTPTDTMAKMIDAFKQR